MKHHMDQDASNLHLIMNMSEQTLDAPLPFIEGRKWHIALDTALDSPRDITRPMCKSSMQAHTTSRNHAVLPCWKHTEAFSVPSAKGFRVIRRAGASPEVSWIAFGSSHRPGRSNALQPIFFESRVLIIINQAG